MTATPFEAVHQAGSSTAEGEPRISGAAESAAGATPTGATASSSTAVRSVVASGSSSPPLLQQIARLPPLEGTGVDVAKRESELLAHLNAILRFYRAAVGPVQKVGEPSDVLYGEQVSTQALAIAQLAFTAAKNEAALLNKIAGKPGATGASPAISGTEGSEAQKLAAARTRVQGQLDDLQAQQVSLQAQIAKAKAKDLPALRQREEQVEGGLELQKATVEALNRIGSFSDAQQHTGLAGDIDRLQRSAPELEVKTGKAVPPAVLESLSEERQSGVASRAVLLFQLLATRRAIEGLISSTDQLRTQANDLRTPVLKILRSTLAQGQALSQQAVNLPATPTTDAQDLLATRKEFDQLTATFGVLAQASLPLSQEAVLLEAQRATLVTWRAVVDTEYKGVLRDLLLRVLGIAVVLGLLALLSSLWSRATVRYVHDLRRRRQLLVVRRAVVGFLSGLVVIFGFVTQFSSLATFAGFISAGIAVGLQTILLSVAAYFFIIGRYGVRVGDRITVAGVTGDVVEVGLVRFYMMELAGAGTELHSTGRVAVFANSVLFQTGTPLYKQMPGTEYAWHELTAKLTPTADVAAVRAALQAAVDKVYSGYSAQIEAQHRDVETWMGAAITAPRVESRLELAEGGSQLIFLFPVQIDHAAEADQAIAEGLMTQLATEGPLKSGLASSPIIKASIK